MLYPENKMGKISLICRFGTNNVNNFLPELIQGIKTERLNVVWLCDPIYGNTYTSECRYKLIRLKDVFQKFRSSLIYIVQKIELELGYILS